VDEFGVVERPGRLCVGHMPRVVKGRLRRWQVRLWESAGADQLVRSVSSGQPKERTRKTIALMGEHVIPKVDTDSVHRTTRFRQGAG
jgi:hypothetical protein